MVDPDRPTSPVAGVIGSPVAHSRSPAIFTAGFAEAGIGWSYYPFEVAPGDGAAAIDAMRVLGLRGLSVTMPLKAEALDAVDRATPSAVALGAVNCIAWDGPDLVGHNTDGDGFVAALQSHGVSVAAGSIVVIGAGGAARAIVAALARHGCGDVIVVNRSSDRAEATAELAGEVGRVGSVDDIATASIVVNATSVGMAGTAAADLMPCDPSALDHHQIVVDIVYSPLVTPWLTAAESVGAATIDGLAMLVHQAARQFELWTGRDAPIAAMHTAARHNL